MKWNAYSMFYHSHKINQDTHLRSGSARYGTPMIRICFCYCATRRMESWLHPATIWYFAIMYKYTQDSTHGTFTATDKICFLSTYNKVHPRAGKVAPTVGAQSIASVRQNLVNCRRNISAHRTCRELRFFLFGRTWAGK
jgi:hypothetical protein